MHSLADQAHWPVRSKILTAGLPRLLDRYADAERGARTQLALEVERTSVRILDDLFRERQTQPRSHAHRLGRKSAGKNLFPVLGLDSVSRIRDRNQHPVAFAPRADNDVSVPLDGLTGVHQNIEKHLIQHVRMTLDLRQLAEIRLYRDAPAKFALRQLQGVLELFVQIHLAQLGTVGPCEGFKPAHHIGNTLAGDFVHRYQRDTGFYNFLGLLDRLLVLSGQKHLQ